MIDNMMSKGAAAMVRRAILGGALVSALALASCVVNFDPTAENVFTCTEDSDCLSPNICDKEEGEEEGICRRELPDVEPECVDADGDGYGEGDACLGPDCNDDDDTVFPGAFEICDGQDNDCDCAEDGSCDDPAIEIVDEKTECTEDADCDALSDAEPEADNGMRCVEGICQFRCPLDDVGVCATSGPDGGGAVTECLTTRDENTGLYRAEVPVCALSGAYGDDFAQVPETEEPCDGLDNNCNRRVDGNDNCQICDPENPAPCSTNRGVCSEGIVICENNVRVGCVDPVTMEPVIEPGQMPEICDGLDNDCSGVVDEAPETPTEASTICPNDCPFGMVLLNDGENTWCMDRFESSRPDADEGSAGADDSRAVSRPGVLPWTGLELTAARDACQGPGGVVFARKRLCTLDELQFACGGANQDRYPYGDNFTAATCNGADAGRGGLAPTGPTDTMGDQDFAGCISTRGQATLYDLSGNASEFALQDNLGKIFGGSFQSDGNALTCQSSFDGQGPGVDVGFRCCFDP